MGNEIEKQARNCRSCQENVPLPSQPPVASWNFPNGPWKRLHIDYAGPFMGSMFVVAVDTHSKCLGIFTTNSCTTAPITNLRKLFTIFGIPEHIVSDNGSQFCSAEFSDFLKSNNIRDTRTAPGNSAWNGLAGRYVGYFKA